MSIHRNDGQRQRSAGIDITANVNFRMVTAEERAMFAAGDAAIPDHMEKTIASRLPGSLRDEAIWQYHAGRNRGVILWCADQRFRYVAEGQWARLTPPLTCGLDGLAPVLKNYDPVREALVMSRTEDSVEVHRIGDGGAWTLVWSLSSPKADPASHSESEPSPSRRSE